MWRRALKGAPERAPERERGRVLPYVLAVRFRVISCDFNSVTKLLTLT